MDERDWIFEFRKVERELREFDGRLESEGAKGIEKYMEVGNI